MTLMLPFPSPLAHDVVPEADQRQQDVEDKFRQLRPSILETLRKAFPACTLLIRRSRYRVTGRNGFASEAFQLAEKYRDFRSLASLCNKDTVYPPQDNPNVARIQAYVDKFKQDFTTELYRWYIEHGAGNSIELRYHGDAHSAVARVGELRTLFAQEHDQYLDEFFAENPQPDISWINDLGRARYGLASDALLRVAAHASELEVKHVSLQPGHRRSKVLKMTCLEAGPQHREALAVGATTRSEWRR